MQVIDRSIKVLARQYPETFIKLVLGKDTGWEYQTMENPEINIPEKRLDFVYEIEQNDNKYLLHLEFQLRHEKEVPARIFKYSAYLTESYRLPVIPVVIYLEKRNYRRLPDAYIVEVNNKVVSRFTYQVIKLWEYEQDIAGGKLKELAPLLVLLKDNRDVALLEYTRKLILEEKDIKRRADSLSVAISVAERYFDREILLNIFREEFKMLLKESSFVQEWYNEGLQKGLRDGMEKGLAEGLERGLERGLEKGLVKGLEKGRIEALRDSILDVLEERFGVLRSGIGKKLEEIDDSAALKSLFKMSLKVNSLEEFEKILGQV
ncbi:Rpn family recombination-promoting nuclease/putative transposase [Moorella sp. ACPs]|uniref:Rpn family recombination-promoting nuclease/putative transposase n=1 Tax=Neomoorella carbonis TaxID=3062783 RepID=UPI00324FA750